MKKEDEQKIRKIIREEIINYYVKNGEIIPKEKDTRKKKDPAAPNKKEETELISPKKDDRNKEIIKKNKNGNL